MTFTEAELLEALRRRHTHAGNGGAGRYAFLTHVRTGAGHYQQEIDAVVMALWHSERLAVHAFEVKTSRADWLREIRPNQHKSAGARALCDTFTIVAPRGVVKLDELPDGWGLLDATLSLEGDVVRLTSARGPDYLDPEWTRRGADLPREFVVAMLRSAGAVPGMTTHQRGAVSAVDAVE